MAESRNREGVAYGLNVFAQIVHGREAAVRETIESLPLGEESPLARLGNVHFARLQIFDQPVNQGPTQRPDKLKSAYLVLTATFDGELDPFLDAICARIGPDADSWWGSCRGYPGTADPLAFRAWIRHNKVDNALFTRPFPQATVEHVHESLALRDRVVAFAVEAQRLDAATLRDRFVETFGGVGA